MCWGAVVSGACVEVAGIVWGGEVVLSPAGADEEQEDKNRTKTRRNNTSFFIRTSIYFKMRI